VGVQEIVHIVSELIAEGEEAMAQRHGPQAVSAAQGARSLLAERLRQEVSDDALWADFEADPRGTAAELTGTLEALIEADPSLAQELDAFMQEFYQAAGPSGAGMPEWVSESAPVAGQETVELAEAEQADEDVGQGTYLYGNLEPGAVSVGERMGGTESMPGTGQPPGGPLAPDASAPSFEDLYAAIDTYPDIDPEAATALRNALQGVLTESAREILASEERLLYHLLTIKRLNVDILEIVLTRLIEDKDVFPAVRQAVMKMRETSL
jgi:hypothetical protein